MICQMRCTILLMIVDSLHIYIDKYINIRINLHNWIMDDSKEPSAILFLWLISELSNIITSWLLFLLAKSHNYYRYVSVFRKEYKKNTWYFFNVRYHWDAYRTNQILVIHAGELQKTQADIFNMYLVRAILIDINLFMLYLQYIFMLYALLMLSGDGTRYI